MNKINNYVAKHMKQKGCRHKNKKHLSRQALNLELKKLI